MKNKKLKSYVLPSLYACFFVGVLFVTIGIANVLTKKAPTNNTNEEINYVSESIVDDDEPVVKEENKRKVYLITNNGKRKLESEKERMQKQIILFMKRDYEDEI